MIKTIENAIGDPKGKTIILTNLARDYDGNGYSSYLSIFNVEDSNTFYSELETILSAHFKEEEFTEEEKGNRVDFTSKTKYLWLADWTEGTVKC